MHCIAFASGNKGSPSNGLKQLKFALISVWNRNWTKKNEDVRFFHFVHCYKIQYKYIVIER